MRKAGIAEICMVSLVVLLLASCATTAQKTEAQAAKIANVAVETDKVVIVDWTDRTLNESQSPEWLKQVRRGNADVFKQQWNVADNRVVKSSAGNARTQSLAQTLSRTNFIYQQAAELSQKVIARIGSGLNDVGQLEAVNTIASQTKVAMAGLREETGFYQKVRTTTVSGTTTEEFVYYTVFSMSKENWENLVKKYLMDLMGGANLQTETQKQVGALFTEMKDEADKTDAAKQLADERAYNEQMARIKATKAKPTAEAEKAKKDAGLARFLM